jgi:DNA-binding response OmpR family regulator
LLSQVSEGEKVNDFTNEGVTVNLPDEMRVRIASATGGGGGFVQIADTSIQLSMAQLQVLQLLIERMKEDEETPFAARGYVHSSELLGAVSWETPHPTENHLKQLIRRLRKALTKSGRDDLIESRQGLGYRLGILPKD